MTWTRYTTAGGRGRARPTDSVELGPGDVEGLDRKLIGHLEGQRILDLGTGVGHSALALSAGGARTVAIDPSADEIAQARLSAETAGAQIEFHEGDLADLAFLRADIFDCVIAVHSLAAVADPGRVFRQVHRVLKPDRPILFSLPHPAALMADPDDPKKVIDSYRESEPLGEGPFLTHRHTITDLFTLLVRANYRVDTLLEPAGEGPFPACLIMRARKTGI